MKFLTNLLFLIAGGLFVTQFVLSAPLISAKEADLPVASQALPTRGISRGPSVKLNSPEADTPVASPFDLKVTFEARGDAKIDPDSIKVIYMKSPIVDLTPRLRKSITVSGIDFLKAEVPPGSHAIKVTVKDTDGRETNSVLNIIVSK